MRIWRALNFVILLALAGAGCGADEQQPKQTPANGADSAQSVPPAASSSKAQPKLQTIKLWIGAEEIVAEVAATQKQIETGMMYRTEMAENEGMLFVMPSIQRASFWMRNTLLPLSCAYIDPDGSILETHDMKPRDETPIRANSDRVKYVLEVNQGWFERHKIKPGTMVRTERGTLVETFYPRR